MTKLAQYDSTAIQPSPVVGWYDTEEFDYPHLPAQSELIALTDAEWSARMDAPWYVQAGKLVPKPAPTSADIAASLIAEQRAASVKINAACAAAIVAGFTSAALGAPYTYTATLEDQANLTGLVLIGADDYYSCIDAAGIKAPHLHTIVQLKTVLVDGGSAKKACLTKAATLKAQIAAAVDVEAVGAVVW